MESDHYKTFSILFGSISFVISVSGFPTLYSLSQVLFSPKLSPEALSSKNYSNRFVSITGINNSNHSFMNRTDQKEEVIYSRVKTKFDFLGLSTRNMHNKSLQYSTFNLQSNSKPVLVVPAYHTKIKAPVIYEEYKTDLSNPRSVIYRVLGILLNPLVPLLGMTIKLGETVTEKAIKSKSFVTVCGKLKNDGDRFTIVPEFIAPSLRQIYTHLLAKSFLVIIGSALFALISLKCLSASRSREKELRESKKRLKGPSDLKCQKCGKLCDSYFEPCLEIVLCQSCSLGITECPKCQKAITGRVGFHIS